MSECKHRFNLSYGKYCKICGLSIVDAWNLDVSDLENERDELQAQVHSLETANEFLKKSCTVTPEFEKFVMKERPALQAQVAVLRGAK